MEDLKSLALTHTPELDVAVNSEFDRYSVISLLNGSENTGIELGVAGGQYSKEMSVSGKFSKVFGVDVYGDHHDSAEYIRALKQVGIDSAYHLVRARFEEALDLFPDQHFDFIYVDGYAHTGNQAGKLFSDWYPKLKDGGVFAGDDYHPDWPLVIWAVNSMAKYLNVALHMTGNARNTNPLDRYPTWYFHKPSLSNLPLDYDPQLSVVRDIMERDEQKKQSQNKQISAEEFLRFVAMVSRNHPALAQKAKEILS